MSQLKTTIRANAAFSWLSGASLLFGSPWLGQWLGVGARLLAAVGAILAGYGVALWWGSLRPDVRPMAKLATGLDFGWVISAVVILVGFPAAATTAGRLVLLALTLVVAALAFGQASGLRQIPRGAVDVESGA